MSTLVTLGGIALSGLGSITWALVDGVSPVNQSFIAEFDAATKIGELAAEGAGGLELVIGSATIQNVYVTSIGPGDSPHTRVVNITDERWMWSRAYVVGSYNMRKRTGEIRVDGSQRFEVAAAVPGLEYASWSLNEGAVWKRRN